MGKIIIVGSGFSGSIIAREIAEKLNREVLVIEKRAHIAGNMYDKVDKHGIRIHMYGPHVLVTDRWFIMKYLQRFSEFYKHPVKELSYIDGKYVRLPFNFESVQQLIGEEKSEILIKKLREKFKGEDRVPVLRLSNDLDEDISSFGNLLFDKAYKTYCAKQWDIPVDKLDKSIMDRVPMAMSYTERYMNRDFQFLPKNGYTHLFEKILCHPNITVHLNEDANNHLKLDYSSKSIFYDSHQVDLLVYTGPVDELFSLKFGELPYRSLNIEYTWYDKAKVYPEEIISYPQAPGYTRRTEYRSMMEDSSHCEGSVIATEYPIAYVKGGSHAPFYPVITKQNQNIHRKYCEEAQKFGNIFLSGRLADFRYYNMDDCIIHAFEIFRQIKAWFNKNN